MSEECYNDWLFLPMIEFQSLQRDMAHVGDRGVSERMTVRHLLSLSRDSVPPTGRFNREGVALLNMLQSLRRDAA